MTPDQMKAWLGVAAALLAAGIWLGSLSQRVSELERKSIYFHGNVVVPQGAAK